MPDQNPMKWKLIDGNTFPAATQEDGVYWESARILIWVTDEWNSGAHMGKFYRFPDGHVRWTIDGTNSKFSCSHFCEITSPWEDK